MKKLARRLGVQILQLLSLWCSRQIMAVSLYDRRLCACALSPTLLEAAWVARVEHVPKASQLRAAAAEVTPAAYRDLAAALQTFNA